MRVQVLGAAHHCPLAEPAVIRAAICEVSPTLRSKPRGSGEGSGPRRLREGVVHRHGRPEVSLQLREIDSDDVSTARLLFWHFHSEKDGFARHRSKILDADVLAVARPPESACGKAVGHVLLAQCSNVFSGTERTIAYPLGIATKGHSNDGRVLPADGQVVAMAVLRARRTAVTENRRYCLRRRRQSGG